MNQICKSICLICGEPTSRRQFTRCRKCYHKTLKDTGRQLGISNIGRKMSLETKQKMSTSHMGMFKGYKHTEESKRNMSFAHSGVSQAKCCEQLHIHHIDYDIKNNKINNLISLCRACHAKANHNREKWTNYFKESVCLGHI